MRTVVGRLGATGQGVFVSPFAAAAGMSFDVVWLVGMIEGGAPPSLPPDPLLPEAVRSEGPFAGLAEFVPAPGLSRPGARTPLRNFFLAGSYTDTGWPATMESAVRSGLAAARAVEAGGA